MPSFLTPSLVLSWSCFLHLVWAWWGLLKPAPSLPLPVPVLCSPLLVIAGFLHPLVTLVAWLLLPPSPSLLSLLLSLSSFCSLPPVFSL